jgi:predicted metal-binding transcription factor (methanogenesis marker protein 9)
VQLNNRRTITMDIHEYMEAHRKIEDYLSSTVKISHEQVAILVVKELIAIRKHNNGAIADACDVVLRHYIDEDEFKRFVINGEEVL